LSYQAESPERVQFDGRRKYLTVAEVAEHLGVGKTTVYKLIGSGKLQAKKIEGAARIHVHALYRYERELD
jgi:excisionase family DNA binding protein